MSYGQREFNFLNLLDDINYQWVNKDALIRLDSNSSDPSLESALNKLKNLIKNEIPLFDKHEKALGLSPVEIVYGDDATSSKTFHILPYIQFPFLKDVSETYQNKHETEVIELGASTGIVAWKALLTGANVTLNDIQNNVLDKAGVFIKNYLPTEYSDHLTIIQGSALTLLELNPENRNKFDFVYSQNLIHFFIPDDCNKFARIIWDLLKQNGKAYITAQTIIGNNAFAQMDCTKIVAKYKQSCENQRITFTHLFKSMFDTNNKFPSFIKTTFLENGNIESISRATPSEQSLKKQSTTTTHFMFEEPLKKIFQDYGFRINNITCGDIDGKPTICIMDALKNNDMGALFKAHSISIVAEKIVEISGQDYES